MKLYSYWRSSASYRVRVALKLKNLTPEIVPVNLLQHEQKAAVYTKLNPQARVPALVDDNEVITQSLAIIEYLDERYPHEPLLPSDPQARASVRAMAMAIACDISPLNNLGVLQYLSEHLQVSEAQKHAWIQRWIKDGFATLERMLLEADAEDFCYGDTPTLADCCLIPQVYNARRFDVDMTPYPIIRHIDSYCNTLEAFQWAHPSKQPDAVG